MHTASVIVYVYAALIIVGGIFGFVKAKSPPSLIMGGIGGLALIAAGYALGHGLAWGLPLALVLSAALLVFFSLRYSRTRAFMPGGLMAILSLLTLVGVLTTTLAK
jgi:uncharacterized membrane protein (UPF0136 family)